MSVRTAIVGDAGALVVAVTEALAPRAGSILSAADLDGALPWLSSQEGAVAVLVEPDPEEATDRVAAFRRACGVRVPILVVASGDSLTSWSVIPGLQPVEWCDAASGAGEWGRRYDALVTRAAAQDSEHVALLRELEQARRLESVGRVAAGVAHDFNNLLASIIGNVDLLAARDPDLPGLGALQIATERAVELTRQLMTSSRPPAGEPEAADLDAAIIECTRLCTRLIGEDIQLRCVRGPGLWHARVAPGPMQQVLMNLVLNARDAMPDGGALTFRTRNVVLEGAAEDGSPGGLPPGEYVQVTVEDTGHGMDAHTLARIGEPYFTTKDVGKGTGLGLSTVMGIVRRASGELLVDSLPGTGTRVRLWFPRSNRPGQTARHLHSAGSAAQGNGTGSLRGDDDPGAYRS